MKPSVLRAATWAAMFGGVLDLIFAPFHGAAYFNTPDGSTELTSFQRGWGQALRDAMPSAFDFAGPQGVYVTYGRVTATAFALMGLGFIAFHLFQRAKLAGWRRSVGDVAVVTWSVLGLAALAEYTTPYIDQIFLIALPSLLLTIVLTAVYGFATARRGAFPPWILRSLAIAALVFVPLVALFGHIPMGAWGFSVAWLAIGPRVLRETSEGTEEDGEIEPAADSTMAP